MRVRQAAEPGAEDDAERGTMSVRVRTAALERVQARRQVARATAAGMARRIRPRATLMRRAVGRDGRCPQADEGFSGRRRYRHRDADRTPPTDPTAASPEGRPTMGKEAPEATDPVGHRRRVDSSAGLDVISAAAAPSRGRRG